MQTLLGKSCSKFLLLACLSLFVMPVSAIEGVLDGAEMLAKTSAKITNIDTKQLQEIAKNGEQTVFIDVRSAEDIADQGGMMDLPRIHNIERGWLEQRVPERVRNKDIPIVVFCGINQRSPFAAERLMQMGYTNVKNYKDGFISWRDAGLPVKGDNAPKSMLYRKPVEVTEGVWSSIGATAPPTYFNSGHNNNLSFIITKQGVVVVNAGDNYLLAQALHDEIKKLTDQPVKYVILENGQGHAMLGSNYWQQQGAKVVAHTETAEVIASRGQVSLDRALKGRMDKMAGTKLTKPDITFDDEYIIELGGQRIEAKYLGTAHSPGDIAVWLPQKKTVISGDIAFHQRLLPVMDDTDTDGWIETWGKFEALGAKHIIPGHGAPTDYTQVRKYTRGYLQFMRDEIAKIIENNGELQDAYKIDQSQFSHLDTFFELAQQNAGRMYREMEFEF